MTSLIVAMLLAQAAPALTCQINGTITVSGGEGTGAVVHVRHVAPELWTREGKDTVIFQRGGEFSPRLQVALVSDDVTFLNKDFEMHNVFSNTPGKKFDLGTSKHDTTGEQKFTSEGWVHLQCNRHKSMKADLLVVQNPYVAVVKPREYTFELKALPPGNYEVVATEPNGAQKVHKLANCSRKERLTFNLEANKPPKHLRRDGSNYQDIYRTGGS
jgi:plastocyanin